MGRPLPTIDRAGRPQKDPKRLFSDISGATILAEWLPPRLVPSEFWSLDADPNDAHSHVAVVACPCGSQPAVRVNDVLVKCSGCERYFFFESKDVWCFNTPVPDAVT